jgi:hypothetical protein
VVLLLRRVYRPSGALAGFIFRLARVAAVETLAQLVATSQAIRPLA